MAYNAVVCNVMIASPGDVQEERNMAREVVWNWNYLHSERTKIILMPITWETHSAPDMGDRPQAIINKQVLERCDLLIGIFWTRLGTPTGREASGTVEEIKKHCERGRPAMLYFSTAPVRQDSVDRKQYEDLMRFKEECQKQGLIVTYDQASDFREVLPAHLIRTVDNHEYFKTIRSQSGDPAILAATTTSVAKPEISKEASELLLEAVQDPNGIVLRVRTRGGLTIQTNGKNMVTSPKDARCQAVWEAALKELREKEFLGDRGYKGEVFSVTRYGYEQADLLKAAE